MTYEADSGGGGRGSASLKTASSGIDCWLRSGDSKVGIGRGGSQGEGDVRGGDLLVEFKLRACSLMRGCSMTLHLGASAASSMHLEGDVENRLLKF